MNLLRITMITLLLTLIPITTDAAPIDEVVKTLEKVTGCELVVTSGYRSPKKNKAVGGAPRSFHLYDRARDIVPKDTRCISIKELGAAACEITSTIKYLSHIHIDNRDNYICLDWSGR